jgi:hypothetical protein
MDGKPAAVDEQRLALSADRPIDRVVRRYRARAVEPHPGDEERDLGKMRERIVGGAHDQRRREPARDLARGLLVRMRVIPVRAGGSLGQMVFVDPARSGWHRIHRIAVLVRRHRQSMPMDRRLLREMVVEPDRDALVFGEFDQRSRRRVVVQPHRRRRARQQLRRRRRGGKRRRELCRARALVLETRERAKRLSFGQRCIHRREFADGNVVAPATAAEHYSADPGECAAEKLPALHPMRPDAVADSPRSARPTGMRSLRQRKPAG